MRSRWVPILIFACILVMPTYCTTIVNTVPGVGTISVITAPVGALPASDTVAYIFPEKVLTLGSNLGVDVLTPNPALSYSVLNPGNILAGTTVNSFHLSVNPSTTTSQHNYAGSIMFDAQILGLILLDNTLAGTDAMFNVGGTVYPLPPNQGLELAAPAMIDQFTVLNGNTLAYNLGAQQVSDNIRILVASSEIPEPSTALFVLPGLALVALGAIRRRRGEQK